MAPVLRGGTDKGYAPAMASEPAGELTARRLASPRLALDPLRKEDADELAALLGDPSLHRFIGGKPATPEELRARLERQVRGRSPDGKDVWLNWVVRERRTGQIVGTMQATIRGDQSSLIAVLAWVVGSAHQGQGMATEAAGLMASGLRRQGIVRLRAHIHPRHDASMAIAGGIGLKPTNTTVCGECRWESQLTAQASHARVVELPASNERFRGHCSHASGGVANTRANTKAGLDPLSRRLLLVASSTTGDVGGLSVVVTDHPGVARFHETRARELGLRRPYPETRQFRKHVRARPAVRTRFARSAGRSTPALTTRRPPEPPRARVPRVAGLSRAATSCSCCHECRGPG